MLTQAQIEIAIVEWQKRLNLLHWEINAIWDEVPNSQDSVAVINIIEGRDIANIRFTHNILDYEVKKVNHAIAHELLHVHLYYLYHIPYKMMDDENGEVKMLLNFMHTEIEKVTDRVSAAFTNSMPLPESLMPSCKA